MKICLAEMFWVVVNTILTDMKPQSYINFLKCTCLGKKKRKVFLEAQHKIVQHSVPYSEFQKCFAIIQYECRKRSASSVRNVCFI